LVSSKRVSMVSNVGIERGESQSILKTEPFFSRSTQFLTNSDISLDRSVFKNAKKNGGQSQGASRNGDFSFEKGYFQRLISRLRKLTLTRDLRQWKI
jgi:hypothetical protein